MKAARQPQQHQWPHSLKTLIVCLIGLLTLAAQPAMAQYTWTGAVSTNWFTPQNWSPQGVPDASTSVIVPATAQPITIVGNAQAANLLLTGGRINLLGSANSLRVAGNLEIRPGSLLNMGADTLGIGATLTVANNWENFGGETAFAAGAGTVIFSRIDGKKRIRTTGRSESFWNLTIQQKNDTLVLADSVIVNKRLRMNRGFIQSDSVAPLIFGFTSSDPRSGSDTSHIVGPAMLFARPTYNLTIPIGSKRQYRPIGLSYTGGLPDKFVVQYYNFNATLNGYLSTKIFSELNELCFIDSLEHWKVTKRGSGTGNGTTKVTLNWGTASNIKSVNALKVAMWNESLPNDFAWRTLGGTGIEYINSTPGGRITADVILPISDIGNGFTFGYQAPLPISEAPDDSTCVNIGESARFVVIPSGLRSSIRFYRNEFDQVPFQAGLSAVLSIQQPDTVWMDYKLGNCTSPRTFVFLKPIYKPTIPTLPDTIYSCDTTKRVEIKLPIAPNIPGRTYYEFEYAYVDSPIQTPSPMGNTSDTSTSYIFKKTARVSVRGLSRVNSCISDSNKTFIVKVVPSPRPPTPVNGFACAPDSITLRVNSGQNQTKYSRYKWYRTPFGPDTLPGVTGTQYRNFFAQNDSFYVSNIVSELSCEGPRSKVRAIITGYPPNAPTVGQVDSVCFSGRALVRTLTTHDSLAIFADSSATIPLVKGSGSSTSTPVINQTTTFWLGSITRVGCSSLRKAKFIAKIAPDAGTPIMPDTTICGPGVVTLIPTTTVLGGKFTWYLDAAGSTTVPNTGDTLTAQVVLNSTYYVQYRTPAGCITPIKTVNITVGGQAQPPTANNATVCQAGRAVLRAQGALPGERYFWYDAVTSTTSLSNTDSLVINPATASAVYYVAKGTNNCKSQLTPVSITLTGLPPSPTAKADTVCQGSPATIVATNNTAGTNYQFYDRPTGGTLLGSAFDGRYTITSLTTTDTVYVAAQSLAGCVSGRTAVPVIALAPLTPPVARDTTLCSPQVFSLVATGLPASAVYQLYNTSTGGSFIQQSSTGVFSVQAVVSATYYLAGLQGTNCFSARVPVQVLVGTPPVAATVLPTSRCGGGPVTAKVTNLGAGQQVVWFGSQTGNPIVTTVTDSLVLNVTADTIIYAALSQGGCIGPRTPLNIGVRTAPLPPITADTAFCNAPDSVSILATGGTGSDLYQWYDNAAGTGTPLVSNRSGLLVIQNPSATSTYYAAITTSAGCRSALSAATIRQVPTPQPPTTRDTTICDPATILLSVTPGSGAGTADQFYWYTSATGNSPIAITTLPSLGLSISSTTTIYVASGSALCRSNRAALTIRITGTPTTSPVAFGDTICDRGNPVVTFAAVPAATNYVVYADQTRTTILGQNTTPSVVLTGVATSTTAYAGYQVGNCVSPLTPVTISISTILSTPLTTGVTYCAAVTSATLQATGAAADEVYNWYADLVSTTPLQSATAGSYTVLNPVGTQTYYVSISNAAGCESIRVPATVQPGPAPLPPVVADTTTCSATFIVLKATGIQAGATLSWYSSLTSTTPLFSSSTLFEFGVNVNSSTVYYLATSLGTGCESPRVALNVTLRTTLPTTPTSISATACANLNGSIQIVAPVTARLYKLYTTLIRGIALDSNTTGVFTVNAAVTTRYFGSYLVGGCESGRVAVNLNIQPTPGVPSSVSGTLCAGSTTASLSASGATGSQLYTWYSSATSTTPISQSSNSNIQVTNVTLPATYYISLATATLGCEGPRVAVLIELSVPPADPVLRDTTVCQNQTTSIPINNFVAGEGTVYRWYLSPTAPTATLTNTGSSLTWSFGSTTTYYVSATNQLGCEGPRVPITITTLPPPITTPTIPTVYSCSNQPVTINVPNAQPGLTYQLFANSAGGFPLFSTTNGQFVIPSSLGTTRYFLSVSNGTCARPARTQFSVTVVDPNIAPILANPNPTSCLGQTISLSVSNLPTGYQLIWFTKSGIILQAAFTNTITRFFNPADSLFVRFGPPSGTGCGSDTTKVALTWLPTPPTPIIRDTTVCNTLVTLRARSPFAAPRTFRWFGPSGVITTGVDSVIQVLVPATGVYGVDIQGTGGCVSTRASFRVTYNNSGTRPPRDTTIRICTGSPVTLVVRGNPGDTAYNWYNSTLLTETPFARTAVPSLPVSIIANRNFFVSARNGGCESSRARVFVQFTSVPPAPIITINQAACGTGGNAIIVVSNASQPISLYLNLTAPLPATTSLTNTISWPVTGGSQTVYISQGTGCQSTKVAITLTSGALPLPPRVRDTTFCLSALARLVVQPPIGSPVPVANYLWYRGSNQTLILVGTTTTPQLNLSGPFDSVFVRTRSALGCLSPAQKLIITYVPGPVPPTVNTNTACAGQPVTLVVTNPQPGVTYTWRNSFGQVIATGTSYVAPASNSFYSVTASDGTCSSTTSVPVTLRQTPTLLSTTTSAVCDSGSVLINFVIAGGPYIARLWDAPTGGSIALQTTSGTILTPLLRRTTTYWVSVANQGTGCETARVPLVVTIGAGTIAEAGRDTTLCPNVPYSLGGNAIPSFRTANWSIITGAGGTLINPTSPNAQFVGQPNTVYRLRYTIPSAGNCPASLDEVILTYLEAPVPPVLTSGLGFCGGAVTLTATGPQPGQFRWFGPNNNLLAERNGSLSLGTLAPGTYRYSLASEVNGCRTTVIPVTFIVYRAIPAANAGRDSVVCQGSSLNLSATVPAAPNFGQWSIVSGSGGFFASTQTANTRFTGQIGQTYTLRWSVSNGGSCPDQTDDVVITLLAVVPAPTLQPASNSVCSNQPLTITATGSSTGNYNWYSRIGTVLTKLSETSNTLTVSSYPPSLTPLSIQYLAASTTAQCEGIRASTTITVNPAATANAGQDAVVFSDLPISLSGSTNATSPAVSWSVVRSPDGIIPALTRSNTLTPTFVAGTQGDYVIRLTVTASGGCQTSDEVVIKVAKGIRIFNAFTPNKDGKNETWNIENIGLYPAAKVQIFSRWNELVFESEPGYTTAWDGNRAGQPLPAGGYLYQVILTPGSDPIIGTLTLVR